MPSAQAATIMFCAVRPTSKSREPRWRHTTMLSGALTSGAVPGPAGPIFCRTSPLGSRRTTNRNGCVLLLLPAMRPRLQDATLHVLRDRLVEIVAPVALGDDRLVGVHWCRSFYAPGALKTTWVESDVRPHSPLQSGRKTFCRAR